VIPPLSSKKPSFLNLFMKKLTRERVVDVERRGCRRPHLADATPVHLILHV
jgi:hypothetical protein